VAERRVIVATAAVLLAAVAAVFIVSASGSGSNAGAASTPAKSSGSTTVERRDLVATDTESGTLSYADPQSVFNRISGTLTWLPQIGDVIKPGQALYRVDGAPVILMNGSVPAYRTLSEGVTDGADVKELKQNLVALGFDPSHQITINDTFDAATTDAVDRWQAALSETQTGIVTLGQVVFLPGAQRITAVQSSLGSTGTSSGAGSGTGASTTVAPHAEFVDLTTTTTTTTSTTTTPSPAQKGRGKQSPQTLAALLALLRAETLELAKSRASAGAGGASGGRGGTAGSASALGSGGGGRGGSGGAGGAGSSGAGSAGGSGAGAAGTGSSSAAAASAAEILQTTSTKVVVTVDLDATKQTEAVVGEPVTVQLPDGSTVPGRITQVSPVAQNSSSSSSSSSASSGAGGAGASGASGSSAPSATIPVTIAITGHHHVAGLDQAAVSVNFEQQVEKNVLSVPVTALLATAGGGYAVQEASAPHRLIPVTPGLFAAGYVQISGPGIYSGLEVTDSQG
jgi:hypothetical protein